MKRKLEQNLTMNKELFLKKSRSGRLLIPRLKPWTGERIIVTKGGHTEVVDGGPDCTSTFESERTLFKTSTAGLSHSLNFTKIREPSSKKLARSFSLGSKVSKNLSVENEKIKGKQNCVEISKISPINNLRKSRSNEKCPNGPVDASPPRKQGRRSRKRETNTISKTRTPSPRKNLRKQCQMEEDKEVDIYGPEFQPFVRVVRLLPEEILSLTVKKTENLSKDKKNLNIPSPNKEQGNLLKTRTVEEKSKQKPSLQPKTPVTPVTRSSHVVKRRKPQTVKELHQVLRVLNQPKECGEVEDEAASTAAFFQIPCGAATKQLNEAVDILNDDFGSDDNLSIRSMSESSPMSTPVSPIGSIHETDAEMSGWEDGLLMGSPALGDATSLRRAKVLHKFMKDKAKLLKIANKTHNKKESLSSSLRAVPTTPSSCQMLQPQMMRALEKDLKKKVKNCPQWDFSTYYNGNKLHVSVNSDSDESSVDSLDEF